MEKFTTIDDYIASFPKEVQDTLNKVREIIKAEVPKESEEAISYGIPTFKLNGKYVIYFAAYTKHISVYPIPSGDVNFNERVEPYVKGKGTLQFPLNKPIPYDLIKLIAQNSVIAALKRQNIYK